jgi:hypothetical protein
MKWIQCRTWTRHSCLAVFTAALFSSAWAGEPPLRLGFDKGKVGEMPPGWKAAITGKGAKESV